jgi:hypothetical protein
MEVTCKETKINQKISRLTGSLIKMGGARLFVMMYCGLPIVPDAVPYETTYWLTDVSMVNSLLPLGHAFVQAGSFPHQEPA